MNSYEHELVDERPLKYRKVSISDDYAIRVPVPRRHHAHRGKPVALTKMARNKVLTEALAHAFAHLSINDN